MPKKLVFALAFVFISLFFPTATFAQGMTQQEVITQACQAKGSETNFQTAPNENPAVVTTICDASRINSEYPAGWKSQLLFIQSYCYSGFCQFPGQGTPARYDGSFLNPELNTYVKGNQETAPVNNQQLTGNIMSGVASWVVCSISSPSTICASTSDQSASLQGTLVGIIGGMYRTPPADTSTFVADILQDTNIAQPAYAQGLGFSSLTPILDAWKMFRNIAYLFFIVIFLVIGFLIMFRQKISGQTVVTAQQALPNVVISLIFVTFSYAIAGLLIDVMYLLMYLLLGIFGKISMQESFMSTNILGLGATMILGQGYGSETTPGGPIMSAGSVIDQAVESILGTQGTGVDVLSAFAGLTAMVVFAIAMLIGVFRLFFELLKTYVNIIISIVISPVMLMIGALPGKNVFRDWMQDLIGNLAAFPAVLLILLIYDEITKGITGSGIVPYEQGGFMPPYLVGYGGGSAAAIFKFVIGLGLLLTITEIVKQIKKTLGAKENFGWFASGLQDAVKRGWQGGELVPGLGFTDTRKMLGRYGGISGQNITQKGVEGLAGLTGGGLAGARLGLRGVRTRDPRRVAQYGIAGFRVGYAKNEKRAAGLLGDEKPIISQEKKKS